MYHLKFIHVRNCLDRRHKTWSTRTAFFSESATSWANEGNWGNSEPGGSTWFFHATLMWPCVDTHTCLAYGKIPYSFPSIPKLSTTSTKCSVIACHYVLQGRLTWSNFRWLIVSNEPLTSTATIYSLGKLPLSPISSLGPPTAPPDPALLLQWVMLLSFKDLMNPARCLYISSRLQ